MNGFIYIHRKIHDWEWYHKSEMVHLFLHLLTSANSKDGNWQGQEIKRGQLITGLKSLNKETGISTQSLRTCIARLKSTGEITIKSTNKFSIITVVKYNDYQYQEEKSTSKLTSKLTNNQQTTNKQLTTNNKDIRNKEYNNNIYTFKIPNLAEVKNYISLNRYNVDAERWYDFYSAKGWMIGKNKMKDWQAAVRTWNKNNKDVSDKRIL